MNEKQGTNNVVLLRKTALHKAIEEVGSISPDCWIVVGINDNKDCIKIIAPTKFDVVTMLGMLEYAKKEVKSDE